MGWYVASRKSRDVITRRCIYNFRIQKSSVIDAPEAYSMSANPILIFMRRIQTIPL